MTLSHQGKKGVGGKTIEILQGEGRLYLKIETLEGIENAKSLLSLGDTLGYVQSESRNVNGRKIKNHAFANS